jgi:hypothetical protein
MEIPVNADVQCADGQGGHSTFVIINPVARQITHLVVKEATFPFSERLVPLDRVAGATPRRIRLRCTRSELAGMKNFVEYDYLPGAAPHSGYEADEYWTWPYVLPEELLIALEEKCIPPGELAVHRGARVEAADRHVGRVEEFLVDPASGHITHLVVREGHVWGQKDVTVPVAQIDRYEEETVYLKLDKAGVEDLPTIPVRRWPF